MNEGGAECGDGTARDVTSQDPPSPGPLSGEKSFLGDSASVRKREVSSCPPESVLSALAPGPDVCVMEGCVCVCMMEGCVSVCVCEMEVCGCVCVRWRDMCVCDGGVCVCDGGV